MASKNILITGAFSGIGRATIEHLMRAKARVTAAGRNEGFPIPSFAGNYLPLEREILSYYDAEELLEFALEKFGHLDVLVNLTGSFSRKPIEETLKKDFDAMFADNFYPAVFMTQAVLKHFRKRKRGRIVFVPSVPNCQGVQQMPAFCASKYALRGFIHSLETELADTAIQVHKIDLPGVEHNFWRNCPEELQPRELMRVPEAALLVANATLEEKPAETFDLQPQ
jgi:NAD(P)-dependent dehydrogenase (short-subunit alcohol dehydrogenase family)